MNKLKSIMINSASQITDLSKNYDVIGIDEVQFFDNSIVQVCKTLAYI